MIPYKRKLEKKSNLIYSKKTQQNNMKMYKKQQYQMQLASSETRIP